MNRIRQVGDDSPLLDQQLAAGLRGDFVEGWRIACELEKKFPENHRAAFNRAWYLMMRGELLKGLECLSRGRWSGVFGGAVLPTNKPIYRDEDLRGKSLLFCSEGGLGDEIINVRFAQEFAQKGAKVSVTCDPSLTSVFARIDGISAVVQHKGSPYVYHDYWVPGMSAGHILKTEFPDLNGEPYLPVSPEYKKKWSAILKEKYPEGIPKIGLKFFGNPQFEHEQHRKFPPEKLIQCLGDRSWINLQLEETDLPIKSWEDTLAVLDHLDLVITSCTSVAHASAALGKPTWVLVPLLPYYIWAYPGNKSPWYDCVTLYRQEKFGNWDSVFSKIKSDVARIGS